MAEYIVEERDTGIVVYAYTADSEQHVVEARLFNGEILVVRFG